MFGRCRWSANVAGVAPPTGRPLGASTVRPATRLSATLGPNLSRRPPDVPLDFTDAAGGVVQDKRWPVAPIRAVPVVVRASPLTFAETD
jgi:hypothetical protein